MGARILKHKWFEALGTQHLGELGQSDVLWHRWKSMRCPFCGNPGSRVTDSRDSDEGIRRRRQCLGCGARFTTYERVYASNLMAVKRDGRREEFSRDKLMSGIRLACARRPLPTGVIEKIVDEIESQVVASGKSEILTYVIGEAVMDRLREVDQVAYIRFASVYRDFEDVDRFQEMLETLNKGDDQASKAQLALFKDAMALESERKPRRGRKPGVPAKPTVGEG